jgi:hypothetical protein
MTTATRSFLGIPVEGDITAGSTRVDQKPIEELQPLLQAVLDDPTIVEFGWRQYTPYFNDGEPCEFGVSGLWVRVTGVEDEADAWELEVENSRHAIGHQVYTHDRRHPSLKLTLKDDGQLLMVCRTGCSLDDVLEKINLPKSALFDVDGEGARTVSSAAPEAVGIAEIAGLRSFVDATTARLADDDDVAVRYLMDRRRDPRPPGSRPVRQVPGPLGWLDERQREDVGEVRGHAIRCRVRHHTCLRGTRRRTDGRWCGLRRRCRPRGRPSPERCSRRGASGGSGLR